MTVIRAALLATLVATGACNRAERVAMQTGDGGNGDAIHLLQAGPRSCEVVLDGEAMPVSALTAALRRFGASNPQVRFSPDPKTPYDCVDRVLGIMREVGVPMRLGFVGNEAVVEEESVKWNP